ncbi:dihydroneopterin aldolase [Effusibacillus dendaii]|uniref:7,8-dihydroneopterin aldolase n=1 Tax=Effusibacillus dendaii TaxID=2743772 RepID=A0A7I8DFN7_9BACL|nr:dihydroneopterin aldolase [Effusibacillus dendaii]BCJ87380.1 dihydroneopterin aldolase [Effusibacillus dendaii]
MDKIILHRMEFYAYHGVFEEESKLGQKFLVDLELSTELSRAGQTDNLKDTLNYVHIYEIVKQTAQVERYRLIETVAETIASRILNRLSAVHSVQVTVTKVTPPLEGIMGGVSVQICRSKGDSL